MAGAAMWMPTLLEESGCVDIAQSNGSDIVEFSVVYCADGVEEAALHLAEDLDLLVDVGREGD